MSSRDTRPGGWFALVILSLILCIGWLSVDPAAAEISRRMRRQIAVMEAVISEALVDSPNLLVGSGGPTYGIFLEEFGVVFGFQTSLVNSGSGHFNFDAEHFLLGNVRIESLGDRVIVFTDDEEDPQDEDELEESEDDIDWDDEEAIRKWRSKRKDRDARRYERGKQELREVLLDYGETLSELRDDQYVAIAAMLQESNNVFRRKKISRLVLKIKMKDLREHASGDISYEELEKRLSEEEY